MLEELSRGSRVVGVKQTRRALADGRAARIFAAQDADPALTGPILRMAEEAGIPAESGVTMAQLGRACGIAVGAAVAAILI